MTARFFLPFFRFFTQIACSALLVSVSSTVSAAEYQGPIFPNENFEDARLNEPLPLPKQNPLLQRPRSSNKQVVFDDLDPVSPTISQGSLQEILNEEEFDILPTRIIRQNRIPRVTARMIDDGDVIFMDDGAYIPNGEWQPKADFEGEVIGECPSAVGPYFSGPIPMTFGMGLFDNLTLFAETTAFKTELNNGVGSYGLSQGINWSTAITPQGTVTAQYGVRAVQGDMFQPSRSQCFMTAGVFKRLAFASVQGGVAVDWLHDHSTFGSVDLRQMRCELSIRSFRNFEYGFMGGFDVFRDRPATQKINDLAFVRNLGTLGAVDVQDYYLFFVRKPLDSGGQVEFRCGATERGDFLTSILGEAAITDRLAVNGGITMLAPSEGKSTSGNYREKWSMSLGVVLYFRGGAMCRQANLYRPMFDVAGNNSFFTRIIGR